MSAYGSPRCRPETFRSKREARRAIKAASVRLNAETVTNEGALVRDSDLDADGLARLSMGRKRHARLKAVQEA